MLGDISSLAMSWTPAVQASLLSGGAAIEELIQEQGWFLALLSLFILGLALNLTPCVYPLVPITVTYFSRQGAGRLSAILVRAWLYVLGIAITYSTLGVLAGLTGSLFGAQLQSPWVLGGVAAILVGLAASLFGAFSFRVPSTLLNKLSAMPAGGLLAALGMGLVMGLIAAPCVGPVTVGLLAFVAATGDPWLGFWMFFALALGLGTPYVFLALFSSKLKDLPKAGDWMGWLEHGLGFVLLGLALYLVSPLLSQPVQALLALALGVVAGVYLGWLDRRGAEGRSFSVLKKGVGFACVALGVWFALPSEQPPRQIDWFPYDADLLEQAREQGQPVILDFYADWCPPCQEMERTTYRDEAVIEASKGFVMVQVDMTHHQTPEAQRLLRQFGVSGVPTLIFLDRQGQEVTDIRYVGYLGPKEFLQKMQHVLQEMQDGELVHRRGGSDDSMM